MIQVLHPSLPGSLVDVHRDRGARPRRSHWGINDTSSLRKARVNGPRSRPNAHTHELIFKSISLIAWNPRPGKLTQSLGLLHPTFWIHPLLSSLKQSRHRRNISILVPQSHCNSLPNTGQRGGYGWASTEGTVVQAKMCSWAKT